MDASVIDMLREAGAVLVAKLTTGELAGGDRWFGGQTMNPWDPTTGSGGSSAGPGSATAGGLVGFSIGTETSGSILGPSSRCGLSGLRPTLGRISRYGVMALSWTQDRLGPMCRSAEDCALVMRAISRPDGLDLSVQDLPFNWDGNPRRDPAAGRVPGGRVRGDRGAGLPEREPAHPRGTEVRRLHADAHSHSRMVDQRHRA